MSFQTYNEYLTANIWLFRMICFRYTESRWFIIDSLCFYCRMHFNCIYRTEVLQLIYIRFNVMMPLSNPTMNNVCDIPFVFICVHNTMLCFLSYHVPMFSLLMYFVRNDKNKDGQSINHLYRPQSLGRQSFRNYIYIYIYIYIACLIL